MHAIMQCGGEENVNDLVREPFYRFLQRTLPLHLIAYGFLLYSCGGMPYLVWGIVSIHNTIINFTYDTIYIFYNDVIT